MIPAPGMAEPVVGDREQGLLDAARIPDEIRVVELMPLGYPDSEPSARQRLSLDDIVMYDRWK